MRVRFGVWVAICALAAMASSGCYLMRRSSGGAETSFHPPRQVDPFDIAVASGFRIEPVASGLTFPTGVTFDGDGTVYVVESGYSYGELWTKPRMLHIVDLARSRKIAIEINEVAHVPDEDFIKLAKQAGLKFTFGTDSRTTQAAARLYYCYQMARKCGLTEADMFAPRKKSQGLPASALVSE